MEGPPVPEVGTTTYTTDDGETYELRYTKGLLL